MNAWIIATIAVFVILFAAQQLGARADLMRENRKLRSDLKTWQDQVSNVGKQRDEIQAKYDELVQQDKQRAVRAVENTQPRRVARNFSEWNQAAENGVMPRGMREKKN